MGFGSALGGMLGSLGSKMLPIPGVDGGQLGNFLGGLFPFKKGGRIGKKHLAHAIMGYARGGEVVPDNAYQRGGKVKKGKKAKAGKTGKRKSKK